jgi:hypothetical protein
VPLDFAVRRYGTDTSGRPIFFTVAMWTTWQLVLTDPRVRPFAHRVVIVQGSFMARAGGGAADSEGYHDQGGSGDVRTWNLTTAELDTLILVARELGIALWRRDATHGGMDPHAHWAAGWDQPISTGIAFQWSEYRAGRDGLATRGPDYEHRPSPLVLTPPTPPEDYMATSDAETKLDRALALLTDIHGDLDRFKDAEWARDKKAAAKAKAVAARQIEVIGGLVDQLGTLADETDPTKLHRRLKQIRSGLLEHLAADPDVDGADQPAPKEV